MLFKPLVKSVPSDKGSLAKSAPTSDKGSLVKSAPMFAVARVLYLSIPVTGWLEKLTTETVRQSELVWDRNELATLGIHHVTQSMDSSVHCTNTRVPILIFMVLPTVAMCR
jgi:hypothetical protein